MSGTERYLRRTLIAETEESVTRWEVRVRRKKLRMERIRAGRGWVGGVVVGGGLLAGVLSHCRRVEAAIVVLKVRRRVVEKTRMLGDFQIFSLFGGTALFAPPTQLFVTAP